MKVLLSSAVILALILAGMFFYHSALSSASADMLESVKRIQANADSDNWESAYDEIDSLMNKWEHYSIRLARLVEHEELDSIMIKLAVIREYAKYKDMPELMGELSALRDLLSHIPRKESLLIENIL